MSRPKPKLRLAWSATQLKAQQHAANYAGAQVLGLQWYKTYPSNTLAASRGWSMAALGVYHALLDLQWDCASLPAEPENIRRLSSIQPREWRASWPLLYQHFPLDSDGRRRNPQLAEQRYEAVGKRWQQLDAINIRHHDAYVGASADEYSKSVTPVTTPVRTDGGHPYLPSSTSTSVREDAYEGGEVLGDSLRSAEGKVV